MNAKTLLLVLSLVLVGSGAGFFTKAKLAGKRQAISQKPFTLHSRVIHINPIDGSQFVEQQTRYVSSNGSWKVVRQKETGGPEKEFFFERGRGVFIVNKKENALIPVQNSASDIPVPMTAEQLRSHSQFVGTETILGLTAYILRVKNQSTGSPGTDIYRAIELGNIPLKIVEYDDNGNPSVINEPVSLTWGQPDISLVKGPNYPVVNQ